jgi:hypothetical protein
MPALPGKRIRTLLWAIDMPPLPGLAQIDLLIY